MSSPSPRILVGRAAGGDRRAAHGLEEAIDQEHRVEGQPPFSKLRRTAHVDEHWHEKALVAEMRRAASDRGLDRDFHRQQRRDADVAGRPQLAREPDASARSNAVEHRLLLRARRWQSREIAGDADAAGRAPPAAAAHMRERDVLAHRRLEHAHAARRADRALRKRNHQRPPLQLAEAANVARQKGRSERDREQNFEPRVIRPSSRFSLAEPRRSRDACAARHCGSSFKRLTARPPCQ